MNQKPTIGRIVIYRTDGRNGLAYDLPAIITCTEDTHPGDYPDGRANPLPVPIDSSYVHLTVFTPGGFGTKLGDGSVPESDESFIGALGLTPGSGTYVELNVPEWVEVEGEEIGKRSWRWPVIVR